MIIFFRQEGYKIADALKGVDENYYKKRGYGPGYMIEHESGADILIIEGKQTAAIHLEDGSICIGK